jgi:iron(III) transport system permease protein
VVASVLGLVCWCWLRHPVTDLLLATPFVLSGFFLGIALIGVSQAAGAWAWWQGTWIMAVVALSVRFAWIPFRSACTAHGQIPRDVLDAAKVFGLPGRDLFLSVEWPALRPSVLSAAWLVYVLALWDVETLVLLYPPGGESVSLRIFQMLHYRYEPQVGALSLGLVLLGVLPAVAHMLWRRFRLSRNRGRGLDEG